MSIEAMKQALEALENTTPTGFNMERDKQFFAAITAIREALAQPEQEPVAWSYWQSCLNDDGTQTAPWVHRLSKFKPSESIINKDIVPLYTTPPQRKPLTDEEIDKLPWEPHEGNPMTFAEGLRYFARAIEAAHGIKE